MSRSLFSEIHLSLKTFVGVIVILFFKKKVEKTVPHLLLFEFIVRIDNNKPWGNFTVSCDLGRFEIFFRKSV